MLRLFQFECKKIFKQRIYVVFLFLFVALSIGIFQNYLETPNAVYYHEDGTLMSKTEIQKEESRVKQLWAGEMDESWWQRFQEEYLVSKYRSDTHVINMEKMEELYGADWYEDYRSSTKHYRVERTDETINSEEKILYQREQFKPLYKEDIYDDVVISLRYNYANLMMQDKPWNSEDGTFGLVRSVVDDEPVPARVYATEVSKAEILLLKDTMNAKDGFYYGDSGNWFAFLSVFSNVGILLMAWTIFISSNVINKERNLKSMELLSSTALGGKKLFVAKSLAVFTSGLFALGVFLISLLVVASFSNGGLGDARINITEGLHAIAAFTYGEGFLITLEMLLLGLLATSVIGVACSTWLPSSYASLALTCLIMFLPSFITVSGIDPSLFPIGFLDTPSIAVRNFTTDLFGTAFFLWKLLPLPWIIISVFLSYGSYRKYKGKSYLKI